MTSKAVLQALAVTAELTNTQLSAGAARVLANDLAGYPEGQVLGALDRCRKELRGKLTLADILSRLDDGRPGPEEAWATVSPALADERVTIVWTEEMALASAPARAIVDDPVAARMAFLECYRRMVQQARDDKQPVLWTPSLGYDARGREGPLLEAVRRGRLGAVHVAGLLPHRNEPAPEIAALLKSEPKRIERKEPDGPSP